jgi:hypothetical protein
MAAPVFTMSIPHDEDPARLRMKSANVQDFVRWDE